MLNAPPTWLIVLISIVIPIVGIIALSLRAWSTRKKPFMITNNVKLYVSDKDLRKRMNNVKAQLSLMMPAFIDGMSTSGFFNKKLLQEHIPAVSCYLYNRKLISKIRLESKQAEKEGKVEPLYSGLTINEHHIDVTCDKDYWDEDGQLMLYKTPFLYEILNTCIWKLLGYSYAYAESFIDPTKKEHWAVIDDVDGDGDKDGTDMKVAQIERKRFDQRFQIIKKGIIKTIESQ